MNQSTSSLVDLGSLAKRVAKLFENGAQPTPAPGERRDLYLLLIAEELGTSYEDVRQRNRDGDLGIIEALGYIHSLLKFTYAPPADDEMVARRRLGEWLAAPGTWRGKTDVLPEGDGGQPGVFVFWKTSVNSPVYGVSRRCPTMAQAIHTALDDAEAQIARGAAGVDFNERTEKDSPAIVTCASCKQTMAWSPSGHYCANTQCSEFHDEVAL